MAGSDPAAPPPDAPAAPPPSPAGTPPRWLVALVLGGAALAIVAPAMRFPLRWADQYDWRYFQAMEEAFRTSVVDFHQAPLWNPWVCGGEVALANPQSTAAAPTFLLTVLFGAPLGLKLALALYVACALHGAWLLARELGVSPVGALVSGLAYGTSGWFALHLATGHINFAGAALYPYLLVCYRRALAPGGAAWTLPGGGLVAWMAALGGTYTAPMAAVMLGVVAATDAARLRSLRPLLVGVAMGAVGLAVGAVRLFPALEFVAHHPRHVAEIDASDARDLLRDFFNWQPLLMPVPGHPYWWHEYCCHLAAGAALLAAVALARRTRRADVVIGALVLAFTLARFALPHVDARLARFYGYRDAWHLAAGFALWRLGRRGPLRPLLPLVLVGLGIAVGRAWPFGPWFLLRKLPLYHDLRVPSRYLVLVALALAVGAGMGLDAVVGWATARAWRPRVIAWAAVAVVAVEGCWFASAAYRDSFNVLYERPAVREPFHQEQGDKRWMFSAIVDGHGTLDCDEEAPLERAEQLDEGQVEQVRLVDPGAGAARLERWSPNEVVVAVDLARPTELLVNENWNEHWRSDEGEVRAVAGRLAVALGAGRRSVTVTYRPRSFLVGAVVSGLSLPLAAALFAWSRRRRPHRRCRGGAL